MKLPNFLFTVVASLSTSFTTLAQPSPGDSASAMSVNFCFGKLFGTNACVAKYDVKILSDSFKESSTEGFALLDGKTRQEMDMSQFKYQMIPPAAMKGMGIDKQIIILRPDLKAKYILYPRLKAYLKKQLSKEENAVLEPKMERTELGKEDIEGHVNEYAEEISMFLEFTAPAPSEDTAATPSWEDAPHPLNVVAKFGDVSDVEKILKRDPTAINTQDNEGMTPLAGAVVQEQVDVVRFLLDKGADPNIPNKHGLTPLEHACGRDKTNALALAKLLLAKGASVNATNVTGFTITPLDWAISSDNTELVKLLLDHGAIIGATFLSTAADRGDVDIAEILIAHGANVNAKDSGGNTALLAAAWAGRDEVMKLLLSKGAEVDPKRHDGLTPLISAADREHNSTVEILLAKGVNINAAVDNGNTALYSAVARGNKEVVETLLAHGADMNFKNKDGETPLKFAAKCHQPAMVELLRQHGAKG